MRKASLTLLSAAVIILLAAGSALASGGSVYVTSDCNYPNLQDNTIEEGSYVYAWVKFTGDNQAVGDWSTVDNSGDNVQQGQMDLSNCTRADSKGNIKYRLYLLDEFYPVEPGSYTLTVWQGEAYVSQPISGDAFRVVQVFN